MAPLEPGGLTSADGRPPGQAPARRGPGGKLGLALKLGVFVFLAIVGLMIFPPLMYFAADYVVAAALGSFAAAAVANALVLRIYERGRLAGIGMQWNTASMRNVLAGILGGGGAAALMLGIPILAGAARFTADPEYVPTFGAFIFVTVVLLFGAVGEEMLFRGYAFQILLRELGPFATILPISVLFGLAHSSNLHATPLAIVNTVGWGIILGVAFLRSGDLWFPIGLHFGWNWILPVFGVNLSGHTMKVAGYTMQWELGDIWSGGAYGPEGGFLTTFILFALAAYLWKAPIEGQTPFLARSRRET
ncbi:MAG: CPBP family intramembrane metalloprotease [Bryobacteraceae bacterium]|nr:CPBP family intramembrane metalloprotease [Bryobacteraceae bacterium]